MPVFAVLQNFGGTATSKDLYSLLVVIIEASPTFSSSSSLANVGFTMCMWDS